MSPQDNVERVLKEIHVLFSKSPTQDGQPDKMIIDRKEFLQLLDRLNKGIFDMMEQYEQTRQSRQNAERSFRRTGNEIIEKANASADDIYAAAVIYTSDAIGRIRDLMDETNDSMNDLFRRFRRELREEKDQLKVHETELEAQLADLSDTKKYLAVLQDVNRQRERQSRDSEMGRREDRLHAEPLSRGGVSADVRVNEAYFEKTGINTEKSMAADGFAQPEKPDIKINTNAAYFKWKEEQEKAQPEKSDPEKPESEKLETEKASGAECSGEETNAADSVWPGEKASAYPNPDFPDEESILRAVMEDERKAEAEQGESSAHAKHGTGNILRTLLFGKDV